MNRDSAENKLLKLIKQSPGEKDSSKRGGELFSRTRTQARIGANLETLPLKPRRYLSLAGKIKNLNLSSMNKILRFLVALLILFFIFDVVYNLKNFKDILRQENSQQEKSDLISLPSPLSAKPSDYLGSAESRDIFFSSGSDASLATRVPSSFNSANYAANLKLLGVISGEKPQAIIEDGVEQKTYTLGVGDYFKNFLVEEIGSGKVRFSFKGENFDLFL